MQLLNKILLNIRNIINIKVFKTELKDMIFSKIFYIVVDLVGELKYGPIIFDVKPHQAVILISCKVRKNSPQYMFRNSSHSCHYRRYRTYRYVLFRMNAELARQLLWQISNTPLRKCRKIEFSRFID
ncbi:hypothetical protein ANN_00563 [Periplaneta americana]|uniref:Uncharacterized protein n=1 Tax=Periplaneta americana TaxID=6978 RepID=A0ABQ8TSY2_PERAM|nr:hypothetical protein ANN_00563 [Periplaneta americana]